MTMHKHRGYLTPLVLLLCLTTCMGAYTFLWPFHGLPAPEEFTTCVAQVEGATHAPIPLSEMPETLRQAAIAVVDPSFYSHPACCDPVDVLRAYYTILEEHINGGPYRTCCGGSITGRLAINLMQAAGEPLDGSLRQRLRQQTLVLVILERYTQDEILAFYLNTTDYGEGAYGAEAAAQHTFGKPARDLSLAESALLQALWRLPDVSPAKNERIKVLQAVVLEFMVERGYITPEEARLAGEKRLAFNDR